MLLRGFGLDRLNSILDEGVEFIKKHFRVRVNPLKEAICGGTLNLGVDEALA